MLRVVNFRVRPALHTSLALTFAFVLLVGFTASITAQEKLSSTQEQTVAQCLAVCKKGDAACQDSCTKKVGTPAYFSASSSCVRACADAMAGPAQQAQSRVGDLVQCVRACN